MMRQLDQRGSAIPLETSGAPHYGINNHSGSWSGSVCLHKLGTLCSFMQGLGIVSCHDEEGRKRCFVCTYLGGFSSAGEGVSTRAINITLTQSRYNAEAK